MAKRLARMAALLLTGCSLQPGFERPPPPIAAAYPMASDADPAARHAAEVGWRDFFGDPRLHAVITAALANNRDLRTAVLRIAEARAQYRIQRADRLPEVAVSSNITRTRTGTGGRAPSDTPGNASAGAVTLSSYSVNIGAAAFELDFWGRVRSLTEAARANYLATVAAQRAFRISLIADVAATYLTERELDERIALAERTMQARSQALDIARLRLDAGVTSALDYRQTESLLTQAQTELASLRRQRAQTRNTLEFLAGGPLPADLPAPRPLAQQAIIETITPGLPSDLLTNRPDILQAEEQLRAAGANIGAARAAFFPRISLTGVLGYASSALSGLFSADGFTWSVGPSAAIPIFDAGRNRGNLDLAVVRRDLAVADYERTVQTAFREVADALAARQFLADQLAAQQRALTAQRDRAELADLRYRNGVANYLEVLDAQRELFAAEQAVVQTRRALLENAVVLYAALGGGLGRR